MPKEFNYPLFLFFPSFKTNNKGIKKLSPLLLKNQVNNQNKKPDYSRMKQNFYKTPNFFEKIK